jgi:hypothetical protein
MQNEENGVAKPKEGSYVEYICPLCGGWEGLGAVFPAFLPFIDHLIGDLCLLELRELSKPFPGPNHETWFRNPDTNEVIQGLPGYAPDSVAWQRLLTKGEKILPLAKIFLLDIADWLETALGSIEELGSILQSDILAADQLIKLVETLAPEFQEQRKYLLDHVEKMKETATDVKWPRRPGRQFEFVAMCMAGARWNLAPLGSREIVRQLKLNPRGLSLRKLGIQGERYWWKLQSKDQS